jgi:hypothetical protein
MNPRTWVLKGSTLPLDHRSRYSWVLMFQDSLSDASSRVSQSHTNDLHSSMMLCGDVWTPEPLKTESTGLSWNVGNRPPNYAAYNSRRAKTSTSLWQMYNTIKVLVLRHWGGGAPSDQPVPGQWSEVGTSVCKLNVLPLCHSWGNHTKLILDRQLRDFEKNNCTMISTLYVFAVLMSIHIKICGFWI